ncbi:hypothetical protein [Palaeococcus ferrophilus]|uniref:hypothetical protein n=1 Tax=Palaeococcus ferrophilus TaxID=83868 RepID=UPI00064F30D7|nr:hypothetical protein [Palaeococcus ferrophilus]
MEKMRKKRVFMLLFIAGLLTLPYASAHFDPPDSPAIMVTVWLLGVATTEDMDDGVNGYTDITGTYKVSQTNHESSAGDLGLILYDWDTLKGRIGYIKKRPLYSHRECTPMNDVTVSFNLEESNSMFANGKIGSGSIKVTKPGRYTVNAGKGKVLIEVTVTKTPIASEECSYFEDQPEGYASSIVTSSGGYVYDWQLANMINMWIANRTGYANMVFIFNQCFGGGMIDDLKEKLKGTGDAAFMSASKHNKPSWGIGDDYNPSRWPEMVKKGFIRPEDYYPKEVGEELAKTGKEAPTMKEVAKRAEQEDLLGPYGSDFRERPQYTSIGNGDGIMIGKKADGSAVKSKHAILFAGDANQKRHWNNMDRMYKALKKQGFSDGDIIALAGNGKTMSNGTNAPSYIDGPGTKKALYEAIVNISKKMNKDEQLIFWVSDHGNRERIERAVLLDLIDPVTEPVPPKKTARRPGQVTWDLDEDFLKAMELDPDNQPYVSVLVEATPEIMEFGEYVLKNIELYINKNELNISLIEPITAYDTDPDLDAFELVFPVDEELLGEENLIEVGWGGNPEEFIKYRIIGLIISTGGINELEAEFEELKEPEEEKTLFELLEEYVPTYNENVDNLPDIVKRIAGNERIDLEITLENGSRLNIGVVTEGGRIVEFSKGRPLEPTLKVWTNEGVVRNIINSETPGDTGLYYLKRGEIKYSGVGFGRSIRILTVKIVIRIYRFVEVIGDIVG